MKKRVRCCVTFCNRTSATFEPNPPDNCWICPSHYAAIPAALKNVRLRARAHLIRANATGSPEDVFHAENRYIRVAAHLTRYARETAAALGRGRNIKGLGVPSRRKAPQIRGSTSPHRPRV